ncbi:MAG: carbon-nitrogen hydrolase family protein [Clostridia bacterium]|nr:carbon-nitrogen hydrolase family protein [Clostridia bacterium]
MKVISIAANESRFYGKTQMQMLDWYREKCKECVEQKPDMLIFPETQLWMYAANEPLTFGEFYPIAVEAMQEMARMLSSYVVFNLYEPHDQYPDMRHITTLVLDRKGEIAGKYRKMHTVPCESLEHKAVPGIEPCVVDTEFGKIGIATCFDIGWRWYWQALKDAGVKAVLWLAAYDGGRLLDTYAIHHMYWVITSVRTYRARVIDPVGNTVAESARWDDMCIYDVDLDLEVFHIDEQFPKIAKIRAALGDKVVINALSEDNVFTISSKDPEWPIDRIKKEFSLVTYKEYHAESERLQKEWREKYMGVKS